jgi:hypothetical protein
MRFDSVKKLKGEAFRRLTVREAHLKTWWDCFLLPNAGRKQPEASPTRFASKTSF